MDTTTSKRPELVQTTEVWRDDQGCYRVGNQNCRSQSFTAIYHSCCYGKGKQSLGRLLVHAQTGEHNVEYSCTTQNTLQREMVLLPEHQQCQHQ